MAFHAKERKAIASRRPEMPDPQHWDSERIVQYIG
jgi:hypothetical protein